MLRPPAPPPVVDDWSVLEKLALASCVLRSGDQNWLSVSRQIKSFLSEPAKAQPKICALQYAKLIDTAEKRKRSDGAVTPTAMIVHRLTIERLEELRAEISEQRVTYDRLKKEIERIEAGEFDDRLDELLGIDPSDEIPESKAKEEPLVEDAANESEPNPKVEEVKQSPPPPEPAIKQESVVSHVNESPAAAAASNHEEHTHTGDEEAEATQTPTANSSSTVKGWKRHALNAIRICSSHTNSGVFLHPVTDKIGPNYSKLVKQSFDISSIRKRIEQPQSSSSVAGWSITSADELERALLIMFQNAIMYNSPEHDVHKMAVEMRDSVMPRVRQYLRQPQGAQSASGDESNHSSIKRRRNTLINQ